MTDLLDQLQQTLGRQYTVEREIGAGGMATVFLARDVKHDRKVALKLLKPELGAVLGVERFLSEIRVTANLQHPNLLPLFDSGEASGLLFYVMPYIDGESLRARLDREKQLPIDDAVRIAVAIAGALDYAHRHHVIHRDLKPENILLHEGQPLIADFGIALAVSNAGGSRITQTGLSLGTPQYMSPEQATGDRAIDGRSDIYSLAAMTYEMLTGDPPHTGSTAQAIIARVLTEHPRSVRMTRPSVPEHVELALEHALEKLAADRWPTAQEFAEALVGTRAIAVRAPVGARAPTVRSMGPWLVAATAVVTACAAVAWAVNRAAPPDDPRARFALTLADSMPLRVDHAQVTIALSPDGSQFAYIGGRGAARIGVRAFDDLAVRPLAGTDGALAPQFSPDGKWLAFVVANRIKKVPLAGGPLVTIADSVNPPRFSWGERDVVVFERGTGTGSGLWRVSAAGGPPVRLTRVDTARGETSHTWPRFLPGGDAVLFDILKGSIETAELAALKLDDVKIVRLGVAGVNPQFVSSEHIVFGRLDGSVLAVPFDRRHLRVTGHPVPVLENVMVKNGGATEVSVSRNGTLAYVPGDLGRQIAVIDRGGLSHLLRSDLQVYASPRYSPDGKRVALDIDPPGSSDIWIQDVASGTLTRFTHDGKSRRPDWAADGRRIAWIVRDSTPNSVYWQPADGSNAPQLLARGVINFAMSPTGRFAVVLLSDGGSVDMIALDSTRLRTRLMSNTARAGAPRVSPDGRWLAYNSNESGRQEIYVRPIPGPGGIHLVSNGGGTEPMWGPDGRELFYRVGTRLVSATIAMSPQFTVVRRDSLPVDIAVNSGVGTYDVSRDGRSFIALRAAGGPYLPVIVLHWLDELRERVALTTKTKQ